MRKVADLAAVVPLVSVLLVATGCASTGTGTRAPSAVDAQPTPPAAMLLAEARAATAAGNHDRAASFVERAMRVDPRNPALYLELADVRLAQGDPRQAENVAMRAMTLAPGDRDVSARSWGLIATARERRGDAAGAAAARERMVSAQ